MHISKEKAPIFSINAQYSFPSGNLKYEIYSHPNIDAIFSSSSRVNFPVFILCEKPGCDIPKRFASSVMLISAWIAAVFICSCIVKILSRSLYSFLCTLFLFYFTKNRLRLQVSFSPSYNTAPVAVNSKISRSRKRRAFRIASSSVNLATV